MKTPWMNKTGLAKLIAISATALGISTGLCGLNFFGVIFFVPLGGGNPAAPSSIAGHIRDAIAGFLIFAGYAELIVMACSFVALIVLVIISLVRPYIQKGSE